MMANDVHERVMRFLRSRPDVTTADLAAACALGESTVKNYVALRMPETALRVNTRSQLRPLKWSWRSLPR